MEPNTSELVVLNLALGVLAVLCFVWPLGAALVDRLRRPRGGLERLDRWPM